LFGIASKHGGDKAGEREQWLQRLADVRRDTGITLTVIDDTFPRRGLTQSAAGEDRSVWPGDRTPWEDVGLAEIHTRFDIGEEFFGDRRPFTSRVIDHVFFSFESE
jgi:hypothetical protein